MFLEPLYVSKSELEWFISVESLNSFDTSNLLKIFLLTKPNPYYMDVPTFIKYKFVLQDM